MASIQDKVKDIMNEFRNIQDKQERNGTLWMVGDIGQTIDFGRYQYRVLYELGKGAQGKVFCVERLNTKQCFAMKVCKPSGSSLNEIKIQRNCYCPNIVTIVESQKIDNKVYMILELGQCNLQKYLESKKQNGMEEEELFRLILNITNGLQIIHKNQYVHHDIKPANIILNMDMFKISDFGISTQGDSEDFFGTPLYFAPEGLRMQTQSKTPATAIDIWALGIVVFQACFGMHPFLTKSFSDINNLKSQIKILSQKGYSFENYKQCLRKDGNNRKLMKFEQKQKSLTNRVLLQQFFHRAFTYEPSSRLTIQQIYMILQQFRQVKQNVNIPRPIRAPLQANNQNIPMRVSQKNNNTYLNDSLSFLNTSISSLNSMPSVTSPVNKPNLFVENINSTDIILFLQRTKQIAKVTIGQHLTELVIVHQALTSLIQHYNCSCVYDQRSKLSLLGVYQRMTAKAPTIPGVFARLIICAYIVEITRNFKQFLDLIMATIKPQIFSFTLKELDNLSACIDYGGFLKLLSICQSLK